MDNKNIILQKNDRITYRSDKVIDWTYIDVSAGFTVKQYENKYGDEILKVERSTYTTIYEKKEILDKEERKYLSAVIKPFKDKKIKIEKWFNIYANKERIIIYVKDEEPILLPYFKPNTMYKGMERNKEYTLDELGL